MFSFTSYYDHLMPLLSLPNSFLSFLNSRWFIFCIAVFYLLVAYKSSGYHQEDEHYQIIEFANYKLGLVPESRLAWEFAEKVRPGLQPMICYGLFKFFNFMGIHDGYDLAFLLRSLTALLSLLTVNAFVKAYKHLIDDRLQPYFILLSFLLWFLPYVNVRFSSETWSGLFYLIALTYIQNQYNNKSLKKYLTFGAILGLSILFRYQSGLLVAGIGIWLLSVGQIGVRNFIAFCCSVLLVLCIGVAVDWWLYGKLVFSLYNYFRINLIDDVASNFGVSPWYEYLKYVSYGPGPFGAFVFASFFIVFYFEPKNLMIWAVIPFLIVHSIIPHKELRFLFPIANLAPLFLMLAVKKIQSLRILAGRKLSMKYLLFCFLVLVSTINVAGLYAIAVTGAGTCRTVVAEFIHRNYPGKNVNIILMGDLNVYMDWGPPKNSFYSSEGLHVQRVHSIWQNDFLKSKKKGYVNLFVIYDFDITGPRSLVRMEKMRMVKVYQNINASVGWIYSFYNRSLNDLAISVYEFK